MKRLISLNRIALKFTLYRRLIGMKFHVILILSSLLTCHVTVATDEVKRAMHITLQLLIQFKWNS